MSDELRPRPYHDEITERLQQAEAELATAKQEVSKFSELYLEVDRELATLRQRIREDEQTEAGHLETVKACEQLRQQMQPSPCGIAGHLRLHVTPIAVMAGDSVWEDEMCTLCESQRQEREAASPSSVLIVDATKNSP